MLNKKQEAEIDLYIEEKNELIEKRNFNSIKIKELKAELKLLESNFKEDRDYGEKIHDLDERIGVGMRIIESQKGKIKALAHHSIADKVGAPTYDIIRYVYG